MVLMGCVDFNHGTARDYFLVGLDPSFCVSRALLNANDLASTSLVIGEPAATVAVAPMVTGATKTRI